MASKSIQILVNEFPAAAGSSVVAAVSAAGVGSPLKYAKKAGRIALTASTSVPSGFTSQTDAVHEKYAIARRAARFDRPEISSRVGEGRLVRGASCRI